MLQRRYCRFRREEAAAAVQIKLCDSRCVLLSPHIRQAAGQTQATRGGGRSGKRERQAGVATRKWRRRERERESHQWASNTFGPYCTAILLLRPYLPTCPALAQD